MPYNQPSFSQGRASKPRLTVNTRSTFKSGSREPVVQSAPVGTRQEKGILPMYQAGDRHCAKVAEMMSSPTWRTQNTTKADNVKPRSMLNVPAQSMTTSRGQTFSGNDPLETFKSLAGDFLDHIVVDLERDGQEKIHLGHGHEGLDILGIHRFPETTEATKNTFIISAAIPPRHFTSQSSLPSWTIGGHNHARDMRVEDVITLKETHKAQVAADCSSIRHKQSRNSHFPGYRASDTDEPRKMIGQDQAIKPMNYQNQRLQSPPRRRLDSPGDNQRFKGLLDRLHHQFPETKQSHEVVSLNDPAIIACVPRKTQPAGSTLAKKQRRTDSGYVSSSDSASRGRSRLTHHASEDFEKFTASAENKSHASNDSAYQSPSKKSTLNPTAKEFSSSGASPAKSIHSSHLSISNKLSEPRQQYSGFLADSGSSQFASALHQTSGSWVPPLSNISDPSVSIQHLSIGFPSIQSSVSAARFSTNSGGSVMIPPLRVSPPYGGMHGDPGMGFGLDWAAPAVHLPINVATSSVDPLAVPEPFHQQIPTVFQCNVPAHQFLGAGNSPSLSTGSISNIASATLHAGSAPFIPKHVPKPKTPNTTGQQNWELMHELRRMNEPGYALKCKGKQKKRYMKQLEKSGGIFQPHKKKEKASNHSSCDKSGGK